MLLTSYRKIPAIRRKQAHYFYFRVRLVKDLKTTISYLRKIIDQTQPKYLEQDFSQNPFVPAVCITALICA